MKGRLIKRLAITTASFAMLFAAVANSSNVSASMWGMTQVQDGSFATAIETKTNFRYEKTIDLTNGDRSKLPTGEFTFVVETVEPGSYNTGKKYFDQNNNIAIEIEKGSLRDDKNSMEVSTVKFSESDVYDKQRTEVLDNSTDKNEILKHPIDEKTISHVKIGADGNYDSVSKPILTMEAYDNLQTELREANPSEEIKVYRFILKEIDNKDDNYLENKEIKILDILPNSDMNFIVMFNNTDEADGFYKNIIALYDNFTGNQAYFTYLDSRAEFVNKIVPPEEDKPEVPVPNEPNKPEKPNKPEQPKVRNTPKTGDETPIGSYLLVIALSSGMVGIALLRRKSR